MPQDVPSTSDRHLIELENKVQLLMEAHFAPNQPIQVNKIASSCEICSGPYDTQYCMENPKHDFVEYASSRTDEAGVDMEREPTRPLLVGRGFLATANVVIDCKRESYKPITSEDDVVFTQCFNIVALELSKGTNSLQAEEELNGKMEEQDIPPPTITAMNIPIIRKGEYDIWSMRMRQYICHTDHNLWDVIVNRDLEEEPAPTTGETSAPPASKTAK
ncbi:hypothetical protein Tco_0797455 [Tanacetum coccineum]